ncbi:hypothetical protein PIB30_070035, partial [Stylosanthes scabra]|nr:hypothetical protein [Stylosanthes scabra]
LSMRRGVRGGEWKRVKHGEETGFAGGRNKGESDWGVASGVRGNGFGNNRKFWREVVLGEGGVEQEEAYLRRRFQRSGRDRYGDGLKVEQWKEVERETYTPYSWTTCLTTERSMTCSECVAGTGTLGIFTSPGRGERDQSIPLRLLGSSPEEELIER